MSEQLPRFQQPAAKSLAGHLIFSIQRALPLEAEIWLSSIPTLRDAFSRLRDGMVCEPLNIVYLPVPKVACTLFATFIALESRLGSDFDPGRHNIHGYRQREPRLQLTHMRLLNDPRYFRFTVVRDPFSRLVSAYVDKLVKPIQEGSSWATDERCGNFSFEEVVKRMCRLRDAQIEKHFRPQAAFLRNVVFDHIGVFEQLDHTFDVLKNRYGIDVEGEVASKVRAPKRTKYQSPAVGASDYVGHLKARDLAKLGIPSIDSFYNDHLRAMVRKRYKEDFALHEHAFSLLQAKKDD
jgi:hypothetical protein